MCDSLSAKLLRLRQKWRNKPRKFSDLRGFSFSVAQRLAMPVFGRRQHPAVLVASARVSPEPFRSRCARSRIRAPCAARVRAGACVCTGSARGEIRGRRSSSNGGLHAGSSVERINGNAWRTAARRGAVAIAQRRSSNPAVRRASIESRCARHIVLAWIDCTARACSRAGTIDRRMVQYANVARDARNERNLATCIGRRASPRSCNSCVIWPRGARIRRRCRNGSAWRRERCWR